MNKSALMIGLVAVIAIVAVMYFFFKSPSRKCPGGTALCPGTGECSTAHECWESGGMR